MADRILDSDRGGAMLASFLRGFVWAYFGGLVIFAFWAVLYRNTETASPSVVIAFGGVALLWTGLLVVARRRICAVFDDIAAAVARVRAAHWLGACLLVGLILRIWVGLSLGGVQESDFIDYLNLARSLVNEHRFFLAADGTVAHWAPGMPFYLAGFLWVFGDQPYTPLIANLILFPLTAIILWQLGKLIGGDVSARIAVIIYTFWPSDVLLVWFVWKGALVRLFLLGAFLAYLAGPEDRGTGLARTCLAGACVGLGALTHPAMMFLPTAFLAYEILRGPRWRGGVDRVVLLTCIMALVISVWTIRNYQVLGVFVPIATNSGTSWYIGNNPLSNGEWDQILPQGESAMGEVEQSRTAAAAARAWIAANPIDYLRLVVKRHAIYVGDDGRGAYWALGRGAHADGAAYAAVRGLSHIYWWLVLSLFVLALLRHWSCLVGGELAAPALLILAFLYSLSLAGLVLSSPMHHKVYYGVFAILAALAFWPGRQGMQAQGATRMSPEQM